MDIYKYLFKIVFMVRFCPICGRSENDSVFYGEFCKDCAIENLKPFKPVKIFICKKCRHVSSKAGVRKEISINEELARLLKIKDKNPMFDSARTTVEYDGDYGRVIQKVNVIFKNIVCKDCSQKHSSYFEAIIQLRGKKEEIAKYSKLLISKLDISKIEELKEGIDIYCKSREQAISTLNSYRLGFLRTEKLAGEKNGKRLYRTTLLVRFET
jgi:NMD protein affecting ribosome stability and mRNA decay